MAQKATSKNKSSLGFLSLLALPFVAVGIFNAFLMMPSLMEWHVMQSWQETPAFIVQADLVSKRGDSSVTRSATASYRYTFLENEYRGSRVGLYGDADNIGSWQQQTYSELKSLKTIKSSFGAM